MAGEAPLTYAAAGVDIDAGERAVSLMGPLVASTARPEVIGGLGGFGGLFAMPSGFRAPVLVASTDGVGTKLAVAVEAGTAGHHRHRPGGDVRRRPRLPGRRAALLP